MFCVNENKYLNNNNGLRATISELNSILKYGNKEKNDKDVKFKTDFLKDFSLNNNLVKIDGSKQVINCFKTIDNRKYDFIIKPTEINNIDFAKSGYTNKNSLKFNFKSEYSNNNSNNINNIISIYDSQKEFLNKLFCINTYANFALKTDNKKLLLDNIKKLQYDPSVKDKKLKYRFIDDDDDNTFLRAVVSENKYKNYDNAYVLYLSLVAISNLSSKMGIEFFVDQFYVTDSKMYLSLLESKETKIDKGVYIRTGVNIRNSELGDGAAEIKAIYKVSNRKNKNVNISLKDNITTINHGYNPGTISKNINRLLDFKQLRTDIINEIKKLNWKKQITNNEISIVSYDLNHLGNNIPKELRNSLVRDINAIDSTKQTIDLLNLFDLLDSKTKKYSDNKDVILILSSKFYSMLSKISKNI